MAKKILYALIFILAVIFIFRSIGLVKCSIAQFDLQRSTHYSFVTGSCMVDTGKGRVYLNSLRGYGDADNNQ